MSQRIARFKELLKEKKHGEVQKEAEGVVNIRKKDPMKAPKYGLNSTGKKNIISQAEKESKNQEKLLNTSENKQLRQESSQSKDQLESKFHPSPQSNKKRVLCYIASSCF